MDERKRATMADIAKMSGYSKAAVSFAFNQPEKITRETYERIMEAAKELDYLPDPMARNLSKGRLDVIGFLLPQRISAVFRNPYSLDVLEGIGTVCEEQGSTLTIIPPSDSSVGEALKSAMVDGVIALGCTLDGSIREVVRKRHLPLVAIDCNMVEDTVSIRTDDEKAAETQIDRAFEKGHRRFAIVPLGKDAYLSEAYEGDDTVSRRLRGYRTALARHGLRIEDQLLITAAPSYDEGVEAGRRIFSEESGITCIITMADITAYGIIAVAVEKGITIPGDCSIIGFDGIGRNAERKLATIEQPGLEKGRVAAEELFRMIGGAPSEGREEYVPFTFTEGDTLGSV